MDGPDEKFERKQDDEVATVGERVSEVRRATGPQTAGARVQTVEGEMSAAHSASGISRQGGSSLRAPEHTEGERRGSP